MKVLFLLIMLVSCGDEHALRYYDYLAKYSAFPMVPREKIEGIIRNNKTPGAVFCSKDFEMRLCFRYIEQGWHVEAAEDK